MTESPSGEPTTTPPTVTACVARTFLVVLYTVYTVSHTQSPVCVTHAKKSHLGFMNSNKLLLQRVSDKFHRLLWQKCPLSLPTRTTPYLRSFSFSFSSSFTSVHQLLSGILSGGHLSGGGLKSQNTKRRRRDSLHPRKNFTKREIFFNWTDTPPVERSAYAASAAVLLSISFDFTSAPPLSPFASSLDRNIFFLDICRQRIDCVQRAEREHPSLSAMTAPQNVSLLPSIQS